jgi:hypothetical protein
MMVRKIPFSLCCILLVVSLFNSCKKDDKTDVVLEYAIPFPENMEIDVLNVDTFVERESYDFPTSLDGELAKNNTSKDKVKSAKLIFMRIQVMDFAYADSSRYGNLKDISDMEMDVKGENLPQLLVSEKAIPDVYTKAVNMNLKDVELKDYLLKDHFRMVFRYKKRRPMPNEMPFIISVRFRIVAESL